MYPYRSRPHYPQLFLRRRESALEELDVMFEGLWPEAPNELLREAHDDIEAASSVGEVTSVLRTWAQFLREHSLDPDVEARLALLPLFSIWASHYEGRSTPWG